MTRPVIKVSLKQSMAKHLIFLRRFVFSEAIDGKYKEDKKMGWCHFD